MIRKKIISSNSIYHYEGINMWEDNGFMHRVLYFADRVVTISNPGYHYDRTNAKSYTSSINRQAIDQMIACASLLDSFYLKVDNAELFYNTKEAIKFLARINLLTGSFEDYSLYKRVFPETKAIVPLIPKSAFSHRGYIRFLFVRYHFAWFFVLLMKIAKVFNLVNN
jgi:hypothetical protein